jgi:hypothetical protein
MQTHETLLALNQIKKCNVLKSHRDPDVNPFNNPDQFILCMKAESIITYNEIYRTFNKTYHDYLYIFVVDNDTNTNNTIVSILYTKLNEKIFQHKEYIYILYCFISIWIVIGVSKMIINLIKHKFNLLRIRETNRIVKEQLRHNKFV